MHTSQIDNLVKELTQRYHSCSDTLCNNKSDSDLREEELSKVTATFSDEAKRLLKTRVRMREGRKKERRGGREEGDERGNDSICVTNSFL